MSFPPKPTPDQLLDVSTDAIISRSLDGTILTWNKGAEKLYGWVAAEAVGAKIHSLLKTVFPEPWNAIEAKLEKHGSWIGELIHTRRDGSTLTVLSRKIISRDDAGSSSFILESNTDITDRKRAEQALRQAEERYRQQFTELEAIYNTVPLGLCVLDTELRYRRINPFLAAINGKSIEEHLGKTVREVVPVVSDQALQALRSVLETGRHLQFEFRGEYRTKPGVEGIWDEQWYPLRDSSGKIIGVGVVAEDVTERRELERVLRERESVLRTVTTEARVGLVMVNKERRYLFANQPYAEILGLPDANIVGKRVADVLPNLYDQIEPRLARAFGGERVSYELHMPRHPTSGAERIYEVVYEPRLTNTAEPYVVVVIVDITERKQMQQTLERTVADRTAELKETNGQLEAFVYSIAHDLRSPLRATQGYTEMLMETATEDQMPTLKRISASANYMDRMIIDLLEFGRAARAQIDLARTSVESAWKSALYQHSDRIEKTHAKIETDDHLPTVCAFEPILVQVLSNLVSNAIKFVQPGVTPNIHFWSEDKGNNVRLWLEDNGIGIDPQYHDRIFGVFERLQSTKYDGTGIGLAIVRKGIERMNGKVGLESKPGKGSRFWIELPKA
jgi:PAS domain S-box-containing protein